MATINRIYPHVNVLTNALIRQVTPFDDTAATTMFAPFYSKKGPSNEIQKIYNLDQFILEYGEADLDYQGRTILNIYNWLNAGGSIYALRLTSPDAKKAASVSIPFGVGVGAGTIEFTAAHEGEYYNQVEIRVKASRISKPAKDENSKGEYYMDIDFIINGTIIKSLYRLDYKNFIDRINRTRLVKVDVTSTELQADFNSFIKGTYAAKDTYVNILLSGGNDGSFSFETTLARFLGDAEKTIISESLSIDDSATFATFSFNELKDFASYKWLVGDRLSITDGADKPKTVLATITGVNSSSLTVSLDYAEGQDTFDINSREYTISFSPLTKNYIVASELLESQLELPIDVIMDPGYPENIKDLLIDLSKIRTDIFFFLSEYVIIKDENESTVEVKIDEINQSVYSQKFAIEEVISGKNIWVTPTYFLSSLLPRNDRVYGLQWPTAGLTRGVLSGVKGIDENPTANKKISNYEKSINYVEKDSRGYKFMSQLTGEKENTALRFINNVRVTNRMIRDLENLGREYLFEFNDATTLNNMRSALNRYVTGWIQNRTLSYGEVTVRANDQLDEQVDVTLNIRFTGTIEIISIDITIQ